MILFYASSLVQMKQSTCYRSSLSKQNLKKNITMRKQAKCIQKSVKLFLIALNIRSLQNFHCSKRFADDGSKARLAKKGSCAIFTTHEKE
mmetsp:Transcript_13452/g.18218  ORF Transcript_13452/g.18218 Transcript_13452/m.18218 type:complete len:90 (-) Transcript_13452:425-694(-)